MQSKETIVSWLVKASSSSIEGIRFLDRRERETFLSWQEIHHRAQACAGGLQALGVRPGDRVVLVFTTSPEFFDAFFGILLAGAVPSPLYPPVRLGRLDEYHERTSAMIAACGARAVLMGNRVHPLLGRTLEMAAPELGGWLLEDLPQGLFEPIAVEPNALALVQFSSGTTVAPKPVALTHRALVNQIVLLNEHWPPSDEIQHTGVSWLPLYHDMGLIGAIFPALERPGTVTLIGPEIFVSRPAIWLRAISRYRATISPAPDFAYAFATERIRDSDLEGVDLSSWIVALDGAEPISAANLRAFQHRFGRWGFRASALTPVYGLSECSLAVTFSSIHRPFVAYTFDSHRLATDKEAVESDTGREIVSVGFPLQGFKVEIRDPQRRVLGEGRVGRLWVTGPSMMEGYLGQEERTAEVLQDGWLDTGDQGFFFRSELFLTGRAKDILILRGRNHDPSEVENALHGVEGIRSGCVVAVSNARISGLGEELILLVEHAKGVAANAWPEIEKACRRRVLIRAGLKVDRLEILEPGTLPRTSSGKLRRRVALDLYLAGELKPGSKVNALSLAREWWRSKQAFRRVNRKAISQ